MSASALDPSLALAFLCRSPAELDHLCMQLKAAFDTHGLELFSIIELDGSVSADGGAAAVTGTVPATASCSAGDFSGVIVTGSAVASGVASLGVPAVGGDGYDSGAIVGGDGDGEEDDDEFVLL
jgi:hypothetical protein